MVVSRLSRRCRLERVAVPSYRETRYDQLAGLFGNANASEREVAVAPGPLNCTEVSG